MVYATMQMSQRYDRIYKTIPWLFPCPQLISLSKIALIIDNIHVLFVNKYKQALIIIPIETVHK